MEEGPLEWNEEEGPLVWEEEGGSLGFACKRPGPGPLWWWCCKANKDTAAPGSCCGPSGHPKTSATKNGFWESKGTAGGDNRTSIS